MDLNLIRQKYAKLQKQSKSSSSGSDFWNPPDGETVIRIVPNLAQEEFPFVELKFYYDLGRKPIVSPASYGERDPIEEFANGLREKGTPYNDFKQFVSKTRTLAPIVVRGEEDKGVRWWSFGKTVYEQILSLLMDPDWGEIYNVNDGVDIVVQRIPAKENGTNFPQTSIRPKPRRIPLATDNVQELLETQTDIKTIYKPKSYDEMKKILSDYLNGVQSDDSDESSASQSSNFQQQAPAASAVQSTTPSVTYNASVSANNSNDGGLDEISSKFEKLFGN